MIHDDEQTPTGSSPVRQSRAIWWLATLALLIGLGLGRWSAMDSAVRAADASPEATATRAAELAELDALRTKVAQPVVCTPAPTDTPTATPSPEPTATQVPAVAVETVLTYGTTWQITVHTIQTVTAPDSLKVTGQLVLVNLTFENIGDSAKIPPFADWRLTDASGKQYKASIDATQTVGTSGFGSAIPAHTAEERKIVFDVAVDAGTSFVLESTKDPAFRVQLAFEARG